MKRTRCGIVVVFFALAGYGVLTFGQEPEDPKPDAKKVKALMRKKLEYSHAILEGITINDFAMISRNSDQLMDLLNAPEFKQGKTAEYLEFRADFLQSAKKLSKMAKEKNLEGTSFTYLQMTLDCFNCHRYVRDQG